VEIKGFNKFEQDNISVPSRADLTINAVLKPGDISETVSVTAETATLQFNTSKMESNVSQKLVESLPQMYRNVFLLAQLDPSVQSTSWGEDNPYDTWASNNLKVGGSGQFTNDLQVDGSPSGISVKTGYVPTPDMVQEVNVLQNASDAEYGHSSGSAISVVLKSGLMERYAAAEKTLREIELRRPEWDRAYLAHGLLLERSARPGEARLRLQAAVALGSRDPGLRCALARLAGAPNSSPECRCLTGLEQLLISSCPTQP